MSKTIFSTDVALFSIINNELKVLLVKRGENERESGKWALPGGRIDSNKGETSRTKAQNVLEERLNIKESVYLKQSKLYDDLNRDPDEYAISVCYMALIEKNKISMMKGLGVKEFNWYSIKDIPKKMAFDHKEMIEDCLESIREEIRDNLMIFKFLPKEFTIPQMRKIIESILDCQLNPSNFRTKILSLSILKDCNKKKREEDSKSIKGQPPKLYKVDDEKLQKIRQKSGLFL